MRYWPVQACRHRQLFLPLLVLRLNVPFLRSSVSMSTSSRTPEILQVKRLSENAILPVRGSEWAAGYDLSSAQDTVIPAQGKALVKTGLSIAIPINTYARIAPRSGLAWKHFIDVGAGVVDYDYRGEVGVVMFNHGPTDFPVKKGDRVAQLILERISMANVVEVDELSETARGAGGFGSTGVSQGTESSNGGIKRLKQSVEGPAEGDGVMASLLTLLSELSKNNQGNQEVLDLIHKCKPLALAGDSRLVAAELAYRATKNEADLIGTLKIIIEGAN